MTKLRSKLGEILIQWEMLDEAQLDKALKIQEESRKANRNYSLRIGEFLEQLGYVPDTVVSRALAAQFQLEYVDVDVPHAIKRENVLHEMLPKDLMCRHRILPISKEGNTLKVLVHDPLDIELIDLIEYRMNTKVSVAVGNKRQITEYLDRTLPIGTVRVDVQFDLRQATPQ